MGKALELTGLRRHMLTAIEKIDEPRNGGKIRWRCKCDCGKETIVNSTHFIKGHTVSCGCYQKQVASRLNCSHGHTKNGKSSNTFNSWAAMNQRCKNPNNPSFKNYGGRGISICPNWETFEGFLKDMGIAPSSKHSIERVDVNGNYCPENCVWIFNNLQSKNRRSNHQILYRGNKYTYADLQRISGINRNTIEKRLERGWDIESALSKKPYEKL